MRDIGRGGSGLFGPPKGAPERPLIEASILFLAFYMASFISSGPPATDAFRPGYHLTVMAVNLPRALLVLYIMAVGDGLGHFGIGRLAPRDFARALLTALGAFAVIIAPAFLYSAIGVANPLFARAQSAPRAGIALIPFMIASSMATGYCEELFFRSYLMRRLGQAGLPTLWAAVASSLLFGSGHGYQGIVGVVSGCLLGLFFAWRWIDAKNIHEIAIGHGLYDAAVFAILVYS
jgi:uncharacterized protein